MLVDGLTLGREVFKLAWLVSLLHADLSHSDASMDDSWCC